MAQIVIRDLDEEVKALLKRRAAIHDRSMEEEARHILGAAVRTAGRRTTKLGSRIATRFSGIGLGDDIEEFRGQAPRSSALEN
jgi:antitoxin FitA